MSAPNAISRPDLTLPKAEAVWLRAAYASARVILEYGSGGSTVMAAEMPGKSIWSVESDAGWAAMMRDWFAANPGASRAHIHHVDIGATKKWGMPATTRFWRRFIRYPLEIWDRPGFMQPDVVLVDGRFRVGCLLAAMLKTTKPIPVYFDDYTGRERYHEVEDFLRPAEIRGRMARFDVTPRQIASGDLLRIMELMQRPL